MQLWYFAGAPATTATETYINSHAVATSGVAAAVTATVAAAVAVTQ